LVSQLLTIYLPTAPASTAPSYRSTSAPVAWSFTEPPAEGGFTVVPLAKLIEISERAYSMRDRYLTDPKFMRVSVEELLHSILEGGAPGRMDDGDTTFFSMIDGDGMIVSGIQSIFYAFGSGITEPNYQITLNCRTSSFSLREDHANRLEPGKRTLHTLSSLIFELDDWYVIGTSGGHYRPQIHWWLSTNLFKFGMDLREALDFPRAYFDPSKGGSSR